MMKKQAALACLDWLESGMVIGIGTGSTVRYFIEGLIEKKKQGLDIQTVCSSTISHHLIREGGIPFLDDQQVTVVDVTFDGADQIDRQKRMIKGGGGALTREKILANMSRKMVVMIDETKRVDVLGKCLLPVEILPFGSAATISKIKTLGFKGELRTRNGKDQPYFTDNGNLLYDIELSVERDSPEKDHEKLIYIPGVIETGYFFNLAGDVVIGKDNGDVDVWKDCSL